MDPITAVGVPGNVHRVLDDAKATWPAEVRENATENPLVRIVAGVLAVRDSAAVAAGEAQHVGDFLLRLNVTLTKRFGPTWWRTLNLPMPWERQP